MNKPLETVQEHRRLNKYPCFDSADEFVHGGSMRIFGTMRKERKMTDIVKALREMATYDCGFEKESDVAIVAADTIEALRAENRNLRSELCLKCGRYKTSHEGRCDGCRWKGELIWTLQKTQKP